MIEVVCKAHILPLMNSAFKWNQSSSQSTLYGDAEFSRLAVTVEFFIRNLESNVQRSFNVVTKMLSKFGSISLLNLA